MIFSKRVFSAAFWSFVVVIGGCTNQSPQEAADVTELDGSEHLVQYLLLGA